MKIFKGRNFKRLMAILGVVLCLGCTLIPCAFAAEANAASEAVSAVKAGFSEITGTITIGNVLSVLAIVLGVAIGFVFFWWGIRKVIRVVSKSFKSGRVSV